MQIINALAVDNNAGLYLLQSAIDEGSIPIKLISLNTLKDASVYLTLTNEVPDIIIVSSGAIIQEGYEKLLHLMHDDRLKSIRLFVLTEFIGEDKHLIRSGNLKAYFITMPYSFTETEQTMAKIYETWKELNNEGKDIQSLYTSDQRQNTDQ